MSSKKMTLAEALTLLRSGEKMDKLTIDFKKGDKVKALDAFKLGKAGIMVPEEVIEYDDSDIAYDPDFDDYEWVRTNTNPNKTIKEKLTIDIELEKNIQIWLQKNNIEINILIEKLIHDFYSAEHIDEAK
ncbi:MAG: hypothetical protein JNM22_19895 [Saprospiraceae bacterium]|nr:hypothetical protein [Saprospiraceae bacterium]